MSFECHGQRCRVPAWMPRLLFFAGVYHVFFALGAMAWPHLCFDWAGIPRPNHPVLWRAAGMTSALFGIGFMIAARDPLRHWPLVLLGFAKATLVIVLLSASIFANELPARSLWLAFFDDIVWWFPLGAILWSTVQANLGRPPTHERPLTVPEASAAYRLSSGETIADASGKQTVALVFLRHFGCTFTRQILTQLTDLKAEADRHDARLVLVHMLQKGSEAHYLGDRSGVARIADPVCELYRAFGLGKGGFLELFGPRVWLRGAVAIFRGCGVGHLAGDGLQMPGAFLVRDSQVISSQPARSAADMPDLPRLFEGFGDDFGTLAANAR
ncbi:hypothetical protein OKA04_17640 [Luteolibacter flavescens]|uniref:Alkyl hydroperoxide reductase subunit C/ Thiol specific antioxidant domain-containing protein n=1 Tax=Luteolibacter flavescens TaxID=1859460 RepID=A0ABT3FSL2_9BACT|nr:hypothetical protein [Luteolibacter flavescens]MCW1886565.1 hypothetical protein [Luteolibacter flavescens]